MPPDPPRRLGSWKEIAEYLRREVRTVARWERERQLPVHRVPGGKGGSVFAYTDELDRWSAGQPVSELRTPVTRATGRAVAFAAGTLVLGVIATIAVIAYATRGGTISTIDVQDDVLTARSKDGRTVWSHPLPGNSRIYHTLIGNPDASGRRDVVVSADVPQKGGGGAGALLKFDGDGRVRWQRTLESRFTFGAGTFGGPWEPDGLFAYTANNQRYIAWAEHHHTWWPSVLAVFDEAGRTVGQFVNSGWIQSAQTTSDHRHLIVGGVSNSRGGAAFAVLDARQPSGASPEDEGSPFACLDCPAGAPLRYLVVEWSDVATIDSPTERHGLVFTYPGGGIELHATQRKGVDLIVELTPSFDVVRRAASDSFWELHQTLERAGQITHSRDQCPYRNGAVVREWTPERGWRVIAAPPSASS